MPIRIVRLGSPRAKDEGLRLGAVRRPPRGVKKSDIAGLDYYDVWFPDLAPSAELLSFYHSAPHAAIWPRYQRRFLSEMRKPPAQRSLDLLAALSHQTNLSVGCYCSDFSTCHRSLLARLLRERGASIVLHKS